ncbi:MBL fold metallo-hydrolase, partial [Rubrivirga sp.]|uniref:MBL fold metallo-hydrolase n=1 Tax=Rubrivirga sp. TaxID=1885344 RepID=UPI003C751D13
MPKTRTLLTGVALVGAAGVAAFRLPVFGGTPEGDRLDRMRRSPQWRDGRFHNQIPTGVADGAEAMGKGLKEWVFGDKSLRSPSMPVPIQLRTTSDFEPPSALRLTWLGHGTTLVEIEARRFLVDPVFSESAAPSSLLGVRRFHAPPLALEDVPALDAVVLTHDHYDHLDYHAVRALASRVPLWICPLGVGAHLERWGVASDRIQECDWWGRVEVGGLEVVCTPARHFSGRSLTDRDRTLWSGWAFIGAEHKVYATGDGGFGPHFLEVGERLGPFDATLVEVGAYDQGWADIHMGPEQGVRAVQDARGGLLIPVHWGTFALAFHGWTEPAERVLEAARGAGVPFAIPR